MRFFRRKKKKKLSSSRDIRTFKHVIFENLEQRLLLSGDDFSSAFSEFSPVLASDNNLQVYEYSTLEDEIVTYTDQIVPGVAIERTEIVLFESYTQEVGSLSMVSQGLQFNLNPAEGMSQVAIDAFQEAADLLSALFSDDITVNIDIDFTSLAPGLLGLSSFTMQLFSYSSFLDALNSDKTTSNDTIAVSNLTTSSSLDVYINRTSDNPNGSGSSIPYLDSDADANNSKIRLTTANSKALGLLDAYNTATNATITFNSQFNWDFDRSDGISAGYYDFVGVAMHEICHALGFTSGVDVLDENPGMADNQYTYINPLDLFRFSNDSISAGADIDWTADARTKFFSINGGSTSLATFSTGVNFGDGKENSHWKDNLALGLMDPSGMAGEFMDITYLDTLAFDVIGWNLSGISVQQLPYTQDFSSGLPGKTDGWEYYSSHPDGRIEVVAGRLQMDDISGSNTQYTLNEAILHLDLTGKSNITLTLDHYSLGDENNSIPESFTGHINGDGISLSVDGIHWVKITELQVQLLGESFVLDSVIELAKTQAGSTDLSDVRIKFQQYDNYPAGSDGRAFDNISVNTSVAQSLPYMQDFESGKPDFSDGWEYYSSHNDGRIEVVDGRLQMDDISGSNTQYTLNEAILHLDLTGKSNITLTLDHYSLGDENNSIPESFTGHINGDGISLSVDGINWVKITELTGQLLGESFVLDSVIEFAKTAAGSTDLSDVRIKFQQYDNYPAGSDGRAFDNISVNTSVAQSLPYMQDFESGKPGISDGWEYYSSHTDGRIEVVDGRLQMDDISGSNTQYTLNEAILHLDLTGQVNVRLTLDHYSLGDENNSIPESFTGHTNGDGISLSVDGINWIRVTELTGQLLGESFVLDSVIELAKTAAGSTDLSDVRIKFQQYDNYPVGSDGRAFDNISVNTSVAQSLPYMQDFESGKPGISDGWEYYSSHADGRIEVIDGRLQMDDISGSNTQYTLNEAILHLDLTGESNITLTLDHYSLGDENNSIPESFTGHINGDGISLSVDGIHWIRVTNLSGNFTGNSFILNTFIEQAKTFAGSDDLSDVRIKFQQYDNYPAGSDGRAFDNIQIS